MGNKIAAQRFMVAGPSAERRILNRDINALVTSLVKSPRKISIRLFVGYWLKLETAR